MVMNCWQKERCSRKELAPKCDKNVSLSTFPSTQKGVPSPSVEYTGNSDCAGPLLTTKSRPLFQMHTYNSAQRNKAQTPLCVFPLTPIGGEIIIIKKRNKSKNTPYSAFAEREIGVDQRKSWGFRKGDTGETNCTDSDEVA